MSKYAKVPGLIERIVELRDGGAGWSAEKPGDVVHTLHAEFGEVYTTKSAIPARKLYQEAKAAESGLKRATKKFVVAERKAGKGWAHIAALTGKPVAELKK